MVCGKFQFGQLIGCAHGWTVTNKGSLNCAVCLYPFVLTYKHVLALIEGHIQKDTC